jgi:hypothetical protein
VRGQDAVCSIDRLLQHPRRRVADRYLESPSELKPVGAKRRSTPRARRRLSSSAEAGDVGLGAHNDSVGEWRDTETEKLAERHSMSSCRECRWWTREWKDLQENEGACMIARTEPGRDGVLRPIIADTPMRAVGNDGDVAGSLITRSNHTCAQFVLRAR